MFLNIKPIIVFQIINKQDIMNKVIWVIEDLKSDNSMISAIKNLGIEYMSLEKFQSFSDVEITNIGKESYIIFHGCLEFADLFAKDVRIAPGAFCATEKFKFTEYAPKLNKYMLNNDYIKSTVKDLIDDQNLFDRYDDSIFVRPNSPLKPFSGRELKLNNINLKSLDYGFYYDDINLEIIISSYKKITKEWRFVILNDGKNTILGFSGYDNNRNPISILDAPISFAEEVALIASPLVLPDLAYILDVAEIDGKMKVVELNPFSGADFYLCSPEKIISETTKLLLQVRSG